MGVIESISWFIGFLIGAGLISILLFLLVMIPLKLKIIFRAITGLPTLIFAHAPFLLWFFYPYFARWYMSHPFYYAFLRGYSWGVILTVIIDIFTSYT